MTNNTPAPITPDTLNDRMEFDRPIRVLPGGAVIPAPELDAPELSMEVDSDGQSLHADDSDIRGQAAAGGWTLMTGYTGQHGYNGPVMHSSEFIGGGMARDILDTPGYYVAVTVEVAEGHKWTEDGPGGPEWCPNCGDTKTEDAEDGDCPGADPAGWSVARRDAEDFSAVPVRDVWHYGNDRVEIVEPYAAVAARLEAEARNGATGATIQARLQNVAAALDVLKDTGRADSWSWHTLTFAPEGA